MRPFEPDSQQIEQRLGRMLVGTVAGVDDGCGEHIRDLLGYTRHVVANHDGIRIHGVQGPSRVQDALGLLETRRAG